MGRSRLTAIERLNIEYPGLEQAVKLMFDRGDTIEQVAKVLQTRYKVKVPISTLSFYRAQRWKVRKQRLADIRERCEVIMEIIGERGLTTGARAKLWEQLDQMTPKELTSMLHTEADCQRLSAVAERLRQQIEQNRKTVEQVTHEAAKQAAKGGTLTIDDINRIRERTFGLPPVDTVTSDK